MVFLFVSISLLKVSSFTPAGALLLELAPEAAAKDIKVLASGTKLLHWALRHGLPEVMAAVVRRAEWASAAVSAVQPEGMTPLELALADVRLHPRLDALTAVVQSWQRAVRNKRDCNPIRFSRTLMKSLLGFKGTIETRPQSLLGFIGLTRAHDCFVCVMYVPY
jgi:hypothetical protein